MAQLPIQINTPNYEFVSKQYFAISPVNIAELALDRSVFSKMGAIELTREVRKHKESGSKLPWIGGDTEEISSIVLERGFSFDPAGGNAQTRYDLYQWYRAGTKVDLYLEVFEDKDDGNLRNPISTWILKGSKPTRYKGFEGDAASSDTSLEELEIAVENIEPVTT